MSFVWLFAHVRKFAAGCVAVPFLLLGGCAVYGPPPAVMADGTVAYAPAPGGVAAPPYYTTPYYAPYYSAPYYSTPYYVGPPVSLGLWFGHSSGHYRGWGGHHGGHGRWQGGRGFHGGGGGRRH